MASADRGVSLEDDEDPLGGSSATQGVWRECPSESDRDESGRASQSESESDSDGESESESDDAVEEIDLDLEDGDDDDVASDASGANDTWAEVVGNRRLTIDDFAPGTSTPGANHNLGPNATALDFFKLFFDETFFQELVLHTNSYAEQERTHAEALGNPHKMAWTETTVPEMKAWIGMNIRLGLKGTSAIDDIWSTKAFLHDSCLSRIMSRNRYWALSRYFHTSDNSQAIHDRLHPNYDPLYKVRALINLANANFAKAYNPKQNLSIDEAMIKFKGRHYSKQYLPKKPIKWGFKVWVCAESDTGYALQVEVYEGKVRNPVRAATRKEHGLGYDVVNSLTQEYQLKNHVISYDRFFSSVDLAEFLLQRRTYVNSTVMLNRKGLPYAVKKLKLKKDQPCRQFLKGSNMLTTVFFDKRQVSHLSTACQPGLAVNSVKPIVNEDYNRHMGGVDLCDQHKSYYAVGRKARKWWKYIAWYIFNLSIINAFLVWRASAPPLLTAAQRHKRKSYTHKLFRMDVVEQLVAGYSGNRRKCSSGAKRPAAAAPVMDPAVAITHLSETGTVPRACRYCAIKGSRPGPKGSQVRSRTWCPKCDVHLCAVGCFQKYHAELCGLTAT